MVNTIIMLRFIVILLLSIIKVVKFLNKLLYLIYLIFFGEEEEHRNKHWLHIYF